MASPSPIIARPPIPRPRRAPLQAHTEHWLIVLRANFELVRAEIRAELTSGHPGARHRVAGLLRQAANIDGQIQATEAGRC